jgi:hypothetical protein
MNNVNEQKHEQHHEVPVRINGAEHKTHAGRNSVEHLKDLGKVPEHDILSEERGGEQIDLPADGHVEIHGGEVFVSHKAHHHHKEVEVEVDYVGNPDFRCELPSSDRIEQILLLALGHFGLERSAAGKYALQYSGVDQPLNETLSKLHRHSVKFTLILKEEPNKG